jgi:putative flippase GtrA
MSHWRGQIARFLVVGGIAVLIDTGTYLALLKTTALSAPVAKRLSFAVGAVWGFFANKYFTFGQPGLSVREPMMFTVVYLVGWLANSAVHDLVLQLGGHRLVALLGATAVSTCTNFAGQKWLVFRSRHRVNRPTSSRPTT